MSDWYYAQNDEHFGPISAAALKEMARDGKLGRDDLIWRDGMERWAPAHKVRGLFPELGDAEAAVENGDVRQVAGESPSPLAQQHRESDIDESSGEESRLNEANGSGDAETAIDVLPLEGPNESKMQVPALGTPAAPPQSDDASNEFVVFEPAPTAPPARRAEPPTGARPDSADHRDSSPAVQRHTRVDVPQGSRGSFAAGAALFAQTFTWVSCLLVIVVGGAVYVSALMMTSDPSQRLAVSGVYAAFVAASYFLARSTERICHVFGQWFGVSQDVKGRRTMRERNWNRFQ